MQILSYFEAFHENVVPQNFWTIQYITPPVLTFSFVIKLINLLISKCHPLNLYLVSSPQASNNNNNNNNNSKA